MSRTTPLLALAAASRTLTRLKASGEYQKLLDRWIVQKQRGAAPGRRS
ncbi:hypothetical protein [Deinococcus aerophilus]|nr:hypothetical protein [Deinococcus aerophilus]